MTCKVVPPTEPAPIMWWNETSDSDGSPCEIATTDCATGGKTLRVNYDCLAAGNANPDYTCEDNDELGFRYSSKE